MLKDKLEHYLLGYLSFYLAEQPAECPMIIRRWDERCVFAKAAMASPQSPIAWLSVSCMTQDNMESWPTIPSITFQMQLSV